ncbi:MAG: outer membrane protein assembly factor BamA [Cryomorphaceae bacterium]|nr:outer membrane protein assembly factor BamA [Cryomorphaceae bacterium]
MMHARNAIYTLLTTICTWFFTGQIQAQETPQDIDLIPEVLYEIGGITVTGANNLDQNLIIMLSGLSVGDRITIPSEKLSDAIKNLWKQRLFDDVQIIVTSKKGRVIYLDIQLKELPKLSKYYFTGVKKSRKDDLREQLKLQRGKVVTDNLIIQAENKTREYFIDRGFLNTKVTVRVIRDTMETNAVIMGISINTGEKVKIEEINFIGNKEITAGKLRKAMKETRRHRWWNIFKSSKFLENEFEDDLAMVIEKYNENGFRDARIISDTFRFVGPDRIVVDITVDEGRKYYFRNITWLGNTKYSDEVLNAVLGIKKGDPYDSKRLNQKLFMDPGGADVNSIYLDNGYLFFNLNPMEVAVENDSIDLEMRIREGQQATINRVTISGNDRTNDHVIMREIRTRPGELFRRSDIQRTMRELGQLGYFEPSEMDVKPVPNPETGTVDIEYILAEKSTSQLELQGGWGAGFVVGTLGLSFNNFSARNIFNKRAWKPLPTGDGQNINMRAQSTGRFFQNYSISFTEPWLGGKKPQALTVSVFHSVQNFSGLPKTDPNRQALNITGMSVGLGKRVRWPDDYFTLYQAIDIKRYRLDNFDLGIPDFRDGYSNNVSYQVKLGRNNTDVPIFPTRGSMFNVSVKLTPPFSLIRSVDPGELVGAEAYRLLEYHKWKLDWTAYTELTKNIVLSTHMEFGYMGRYNTNLAVSPFERFFMGGDGLMNFALDGREIIALRGYPNNSIVPQPGNFNIGGTVYNKFTAEVRFLVSPNPNAQIWPIIFAEAGNNHLDIRDFNPFSLRRSVGTGLRIFMPMFGLLGIDLGYGFDPAVGATQRSGWNTHFIIGQQF